MSCILAFRPCIVLYSQNTFTFNTLWHRQRAQSMCCEGQTGVKRLRLPCFRPSVINQKSTSWRLSSNSICFDLLWICCTTNRKSGVGALCVWTRNRWKTRWILPSSSTATGARTTDKCSFTWPSRHFMNIHDATEACPGRAARSVMLF